MPEAADPRGLAWDSQVETHAAMKLYMDSERWRGVPFAAPGSLPLTCTGVATTVRCR
jgi:glucose-6-phosphate 1-dehydrogenase